MAETFFLGELCYQVETSEKTIVHISVDSVKVRNTDAEQFVSVEGIMIDSENGQKFLMPF